MFSKVISPNSRSKSSTDFECDISSTNGQGGLLSVKFDVASCEAAEARAGKHSANGSPAWGANHDDYKGGDSAMNPLK
jgi:hypothetical protein